MERITIGCKVDIETAERIRKEAEKKKQSLNEYVKAKIDPDIKIMSPPFKELDEKMEWIRFDMNSDDWCRKLNEKIDNQEIKFEGAEIVLKTKVNLEQFCNACKEKDLDPQEQIDKFTKMIWNMRTGGAGGA